MFRQFLILISCLVMLTSPAWAETSPREVVEQFQEALLTSMRQGDKLSFQARYDQLRSAVSESHDLAKIARIVVGRTWQELSPEQQQQLVETFSRLSIASYANNFKSYSGESFAFKRQETTPRGGVVIHTQLQIPNDDTVNFDYMLKETGGRWQIINIIANGVSDLALKRSEYTAILNRDDFATLIAKMQEKIALYSQE
ncbi:MAG: ABC transporter substrate-binding protein [Methylococcales bacterium]|nr:ABC transporter substrate-binding protein [Methylococcales bacterium]